MVDVPVESIVDERLSRLLALVHNPLPAPQLKKENTALLIIDVQYLTCHPDWGMGIKAREKGFFDDLEWYWTRSRNVMIPNIQRLIATCRQVGVEVIHSRIATLTRDGRDTTRRYKALGVSTTPDAKEAEILPEVAPQGDEIVLSKLTSSVFNSTTLETVLHNIGIQNLIVVGLATDGCVESTVRTATEKDYGVILVEDACGTIAPQLHEAAVLIMGYKDAIIKSTDQMVAELEAL
jgi:nicotinamidase-related amidase